MENYNNTYNLYTPTNEQKRKAVLAKLYYTLFTDLNTSVSF